MTFLIFIFYFVQSQSNQSSTPDWGIVVEPSQIVSHLSDLVQQRWTYFGRLL